MSDSKAKKDGKYYGQQLINFINYAWTPFHAVAESGRLLEQAGFQHLSESDQWNLKAGGRYYFTRNQSSLVAFAIGGKYEAGGGVVMLGAHTDSPCFKVKPNAATGRCSYLQLGVAPYGGGLWHTWFDRDLSVAGRLLVKDADGNLRHTLVKIERPIMRIPMLAIHLQRDLQGFKPDTQQHTEPILCTQLADTIKEKLNKGTNGAKAGTPNSKTGFWSSSNEAGSVQQRQHSCLIKALAEAAGCAINDIVDIELNICDTQPSAIGGIHDEFIYSGRLDNLCMSYCSITGLIDSLDGGDNPLKDDTVIRCIALFDHEEVGSDSAQGAGGTIMHDTLTRLTKSLGDGVKENEERCVCNSLCVSADMAHAIHPNYPEKHETYHQPIMGKGMVVKHNANQRYATNAVNASIFREVANQLKLPYQEFVVRNDMPCGSTIGPILATRLGVSTVDVGLPQFSMHSIREMAHVQDVMYGVQHIEGVFRLYSKIDKTVLVDKLPAGQLPMDAPSCEHVANS